MIDRKKRRDEREIIRQEQREERAKIREESRIEKERKYGPEYGEVDKEMLFKEARETGKVLSAQELKLDEEELENVSKELQKYGVKFSITSSEDEKHVFHFEAKNAELMKQGLESYVTKKQILKEQDKQQDINAFNQQVEVTLKEAKEKANQINEQRKEVVEELKQARSR